MFKKAVLTITPAAALQVQNLLDKRNKPSAGIRIGVKSGGCSGMKYFVEYADDQQPFDEIVQEHGITIFIDPKALMYLLGSQMDYIEEDFKSGFTFVNPNAKAKCGCGSSFNI
ncbi:MAG: iron-sulfur cluster assembly accessory protein [Rickettsiaceae bacterium]|nr:iron-sulfur cluster assembly accessory protein [Rickettsiaceae bacterium]